jgi:uncharacterized protein YndB with AHSA1/START domain
MTNTAAAGAAVQASIEVQAPRERAFHVFTAEMASWWPPDHHLLAAELAEMVLEPRVGGRIYDRGTDGSECTWARVLAFEPPERLVFSWDISPEWQVESDPGRTSEVEVRFISVEENRTLVELRHSHLERHGEGWERMRDAVGSPGGWGRGLRALAEVLAG